MCSDNHGWNLLSKNNYGVFIDICIFSVVAPSKAAEKEPSDWRMRSSKTYNSQKINYKGLVVIV